MRSTGIAPFEWLLAAFGWTSSGRGQQRRRRHIRNWLRKALSNRNGVEPYDYLYYLFEELPKATTAAQLETLLPWNAKAAVAAAIAGAELAA